VPNADKGWHGGMVATAAPGDRLFPVATDSHPIV
jgi:hypothetical protein